MTNLAPTIRVMLLSCTITLLVGCSVTEPEPKEVLSIKYTVAPHFFSQWLIVDRNATRWVHYVANVPEYDRDSTISDTMFLNTLISTVNLADAMRQGNRINHQDLAEHGTLYLITIELSPDEPGSSTAKKVIQYTGAPPASIRELIRAMSTRMSQISGR